MVRDLAMTVVSYKPYLLHRDMYLFSPSWDRAVANDSTQESTLVLSGFIWSRARQQPTMPRSTFTCRSMMFVFARCDSVTLASFLRYFFSHS